MTNEEKIKFLLLNFPQTKFLRGDFWVQYLIEFRQMRPASNGEYAIEPIQLRAFFSEFPTIERTLRKILKEDKNFQLPPEANLKRSIKARGFAIQYAKQ